MMQQSLFDDAAWGAGTNDYHVLPATDKQIQFAQRIAERSKAELSEDVLLDRQKISRWIDQHARSGPVSKFSNYPSSKQVAFAERIARIKRRAVPRECFQDRTLMSRWIDGNR